jgi:hypothetical protein
MRRTKRIPGTIVFLTLALTALLVVVLSPLPSGFVFIALAALSRITVTLPESPPLVPAGLTLPVRSSRAPPLA